MSNIILCWPNQVESATLTSTSTWETNLPLTEMQTRIFDDVAQTSDLTPDVTATFSSYTRVGTIAIAAHNFSSSATIRIRLYSDAAKTILLEDSGTIDVWPRVYDSKDLAWEAPNFWTGKPLQADIDKFTRLFVWHGAQNYYLKAIVIEITDSTNTDTYIQIGRLFLAPRFEPTINPEYGKLDYQYITKTEVFESVDEKSTEYFKVRKPKRQVILSLDWLTQNEGFLQLLDMQKTQDIYKEILFAEKKEIDVFSIAHTFIGRNDKLDKLSTPHHQIYSNSISLLEIL